MGVSGVASGRPDAPITPEEWHGWGWTDNRRSDLYVGPLPRRKRLALYLEYTDEDNVTRIRVLAYFRYPRDAYAAMSAIDYLTGHRR